MTSENKDTSGVPGKSTKQPRGSTFDALDEISRKRGHKVPLRHSEKPKKTFKQKLRNGILTGLGVATAIEALGTGIGVGVDPKPISGHEIAHEATQWPFTIIDRIKNGETVMVPNTYDYTATKGVLGENNMVQMTPEEYAKNGPQLFENGYQYIPLSIGFRDGKIRTLNYELTEWQGSPDIGELSTNTIGPFLEGETYKSPYNGEIWFEESDQKDLKDFYMDIYDSEGKKVSTLNLMPTRFTRIVPYGASNRYFVNGDPRVRIQVKVGDDIGVFSTGGQLKIYGLKGNCPAVIAPTPDGKAINIVPTNFKP